MLGIILMVSGLSFQAPEDSLKTKLNEVVVTAVRGEQKLFDVPAAMSVITQKYIFEQAARTTPEILMSAPGVFLQKTNHGGGSPFVRGLTGNQTLLLVDGIRLNNSTFRYGPNQYFNTIQPFEIEQVEILRSGGSVQYGSDALGGTIQVITSQPSFATGWKGKLGGRWATSQQEQTANMALSFGGDKIASSLSGALRKFGDLKGGKQTGIQHPSGYQEQMLDFKTVLQKGFTFAHQYFEASHVPVYHKVALENFQLNEFRLQRRNLSYLKYEHASDHPLFNKLQLTASLQQTKEGRRSEKNGATNETLEEDKVKTYGFSAVVTSGKSSIWQANTGIEYYTDAVRSTKSIVDLSNGVAVSARGLYPDRATAASLAAFSIHSFSYQQWKLTAGLRFSHFLIDLTDEILGRVKINPMAIRPALALSRFLGEQWHVFANYSGGFRAPNIDDMGTLGIVDFRYEVPSYDLKPEKSDAIDLGLKFRTAQYSFTASAFYTKLSQLISREKVEGQIINEYQVYEKVNSQDAYIKGFELSADLQVLEDLQLYGHTSYTYGQNLSKSEPLRRIPPLHGLVGLAYHYGSYFIRPEFLYAAAQNRLSAGDKDDNRIDPNGTDGWAIVNFSTGFNKKHYDLTAQLQNLGNVDYRMHGSGINGPGSTLLIRLDLKF